METLFRFATPPSPCGYLPDQTWTLEYDIVSQATPEEYMGRMKQGWRRFGHALFHPVCAHCQQCRSLRVVVDRFTPNRSQRRCRRLNAGEVRLEIGEPAVTREKLALYDRYHAFQTDHKGWPGHDPKSPRSYIESFVANPFPTEEWRYYLGDRLVAVSYVDALPEGLSAIYCFYEPALRDRSLGTWNVLSVIEQASLRGLPHVYLGYFVAGCPSLAYKAHFRPSQVRDPSGAWVDFAGA